jgi:hypothetical protein
MIRVFIGFDPVESQPWHVMAHSIFRQSSVPVSITPVALDNLKGVLTRERHPLQSNDFAFSRWLVPWLSGYEGWSAFFDCDMLLRDDIANLWGLRDDNFAVMCVHHDHVPVEKTKYLGTTQTTYERKNWSSVMLFNNARCKALTPEYVNTASGLDLHQFKWLKDEEIGYLPKEWNFLEGYQRNDGHAKLVHWTIGGPYFKEYENADYHVDYWTEYSRMNYVLQLDELEQIKAQKAASAK